MKQLVLLAFALAPVVAPAASFSLGAVLRAGGLFEDEMQLGSAAASPAASSGLFPYWIDGVDHNFQLSYNAATNTASLSGDWLGLFTSNVSWTVSGGAASSLPREWNIGAGGVQLTAVNNPSTNTSIRLQNLSISGPGLAVINPPTITASQTGSGTVTAGNATPITFTTPNGGGSWVLTGQVRFTGLAGIFGGGGASGNGLRAAFDLFASDVPEPESLLLSALGLAALGALYRHRLNCAMRLNAIKTTGHKQPAA